MAVKVLDAGGKLMFSGDLRAEVGAALDGCLARGAKLITPVERLGGFWVAACTLPRKSSPDDSSTSLRLSDLADDARSKSLRDAPEFDDGCTVEEFGFKLIITGPSSKAVELRIEHLKQFGADVIGSIEQDGDHWTVVVDTGGADKAYRW